MLDEKDLMAIGQLIDQKLDQKLTQQKQEILGEMDQKLAQQKQELLGEMAKQKKEILAESTHNMKVLLDTEVRTQFNLLAEDISIIMEKMIPESRIEAIEDQIDVLKASVKRINQELRELKKAQ